MDIFRPPFRLPVLCIDNFLPEAEAQTVLQICVGLKGAYVAGRVVDGTGSTKLDTTARKNDVYFDDVAETRLSDIRGILQRRIWTKECRKLWHEGYSIFDVINYATWHEVVASRYGEGGFYKKHHDTLKDDLIPRRLITLVFYVNKEPRQFDGGALIIWSGADKTAIEPKHNRAVVFPSFAFHEVEVVRMNSAHWEDARFSLNFWIGFQS
jgi:predicted 2-oxoglutarate/Fe(II)-dependent dioxygenase YbiX